MEAKTESQLKSSAHGVGVGTRSAAEVGGTAVVEGGGAFFVVDELFGGLAGARGVLHEAQAVELAPRSRPAEEKAADVQL